MKKYQIVLQFTKTEIEDFDRLIKIEDELIDYLKGLADIDGHDFGSGEMNIFIITANLFEVFSKVKKYMSEKGLLSNLKAAYREMGKDDYIILWPPNIKDFKLI